MRNDKTPQVALPFCGVYCIARVATWMKNNFPKRKHARLDYYDYSTDGAYFITICTQNRRCLLSRPTRRLSFQAGVLCWPGMTVVLCIEKDALWKFLQSGDFFLRPYPCNPEIMGL